MSSTPTIRRATAGDATTLAALVREYWAFEGIDGFDEVRIRRVLGRLLAQPALGCAWVVEHGGRPVGYLAAVYAFSIEHGGLTAEIDELYLESAHRGCGLGKLLIETAEAGFASAGCTNVSFQLGRSNDAARAFYARCGYRLRDGYELMDKTLTLPAK